MKPSPPNLFESLFDFHPREDHKPKENFLTEAFAYILRTDQSVCRAWLSFLLGKNAEDVLCEVTTRQTEKDPDTDASIYPDLLLEGQVSDGDKFALYCEHKWDSPCNQHQLQKYCKVAGAKGQHARLVFVGAGYKQKSDAQKCFQQKSCMCFLWEDVFNVLDALAEKSTVLTEFLGFMKSHGLSPGQPLTVERMTAFLQSSDFIKSLMNMANKLSANYVWDVIPKRFHAKNYVRDAWGRAGIRFETKDWRPVITLGFLYDAGALKKVSRSLGLILG